MCHYITASLPGSVDLKSIVPVFDSHNVGFELISNAHVTQQLDPQDLYILTSGKHCDCGTALGSLNRDPEKVVSYERELKKLRKQGWSEAKIQRWLEQKEETNQRHAREDDARVKRGSPELNSWIGLINDLIGSKLTPRLSILLHLYHGAIESERIKIQRRERVKLAEVSSERLMKIEEDVLYEVVS